MFKRLVASLALDYEFIARGRGILSKEEMDMITAGDRTRVLHPELLTPVGAKPTYDDKIDLDECGLIVDHIQQVVEWIDQLGRNEIV